MELAASALRIARTQAMSRYDGADARGARTPLVSHRTRGEPGRGAQGSRRRAGSRRGTRRARVRGTIRRRQGDARGSALGVRGGGRVVAQKGRGERGGSETIATDAGIAGSSRGAEDGMTHASRPQHVSRASLSALLSVSPSLRLSLFRVHRIVSVLVVKRSGPWDDGRRKCVLQQLRAEKRLRDTHRLRRGIHLVPLPHDVQRPNEGIRADSAAAATRSGVMTSSALGRGPLSTRFSRSSWSPNAGHAAPTTMATSGRFPSAETSPASHRGEHRAPTESQDAKFKGPRVVEHRGGPRPRRQARSPRTHAGRGGSTTRRTASSECGPSRNSHSHVSALASTRGRMYAREAAVAPFPVQRVGVSAARRRSRHQATTRRRHRTCRHLALTLLREALHLVETRRRHGPPSPSNSARRTLALRIAATGKRTSCVGAVIQTAEATAGVIRCDVSIDTARRHRRDRRRC